MELSPEHVKLNNWQEKFINFPILHTKQNFEFTVDLHNTKI